MCLYSQVRVLCLQVPRLPKDLSVEWHINFDLDKTLLQPYSASKCLNIDHISYAKLQHALTFESLVQGTHR